MPVLALDPDLHLIGIAVTAALDEEGNLRSAKETSHTQLTRLEYKYDAQGNWTELVVWSRLEPNPNFQRSNVERRQFTYYPK